MDPVKSWAAALSGRFSKPFARVSNIFSVLLNDEKVVTGPLRVSTPETRRQTEHNDLLRRCTAVPVRPALGTALDDEEDEEVRETAKEALERIEGDGQKAR